MSTVPLSGADMKRYVQAYGQFNKTEEEKVCEVVADVVRKVIEVHSSSNRKLTNLDDAMSYFLDYVEDLLKTGEGEIATKVETCAKEVLAQQNDDLSDTIQWSAIDYLMELFEKHKIQ